ncbi:MAG TPA: FlgD immunoglobulin-like domain containing protein, partial [bacterium]|nr:FlgD immunoglobulin-like domain containing protein [bacterium]
PLSPALQAWPNPSPGAMFIRYRVDREATARLRIFDAAGRLVQTWDQGQQFAGSHEVSWDGRDRGGLRVSSGSYLMTLEYGTRHETARIVILR